MAIEATKRTFDCLILRLAATAANAPAQTQRNQTADRTLSRFSPTTWARKPSVPMVETSYRTPAIGRLAATGMRFENAYAHTLCTPSRVALMTGQYNLRNHPSWM
jgi:arylsulfatase A-like enzyme